MGSCPFALSFTLFTFIWYQHYAFFRRYCLEDPLTIFLNSALLLVALFFVFPLKFLFSRIFTTGKLPFDQLRAVFTIYSLGFTAVFLILSLLYANAYRQCSKLDLNSLEEFDTTSDVWGNLSVATVGLGSVALAQFPATTNFAGFFYFAIAIVRTVYQTLSARRWRLLEPRFLTGKAAEKKERAQAKP